MRALSGVPKRSASRLAIGRAPIVKMSRRMPPTPVAAPWNGSMNDGWLWLSILKMAARPSPMSTAPAFSPGPCSTCGPVVGSCFRNARELLYEQCSDHIAPNTPISSNVGGRLPRSSTILAYSSAVRPCSAAVSTVTGRAIDPLWPRNDARLASLRGRPWLEPRLRRAEQLEPVLAAGQPLDRVLGMRHQPDDVPP